MPYNIFQNCCRPFWILQNLLSPPDSGPPEPVERTLYLTDYFQALDGDVKNFTLGSFGFVSGFSMQTLSSGLQGAIHADCGIAYFGTNYTFWVSLPSTEPVPTDWVWFLAADPGNTFPITLTGIGVYTDYACVTEVFTPADLSTWFPYYIVAWLQNEVTPTTEYINDPAVSTRFNTCVIEGLGANAVGIITNDGADVTATINHIPNIPGLSAKLFSWDASSPELQTTLTPYTCP